MDGTKLANNIRDHRISNGLTQTEVARRLFVTPQTVSKWESGLALPDLPNLCGLAAVLRTTPDRLLGVGQTEDVTYLGIDAGGTKTDLVLFCADGRVLRRLTAPGANPNACGMERAAQILSENIRKISEGYTLSGLFAGIAGVASGDNRSKLTASLRKQLPGIPFTLESDIENVIFSVRGAESCIAVICGTGSVVYARDGAGLHRFGGFGYLFDGLGSGYDLGRDALVAAFEADDGLREPSELTRMVHEKLEGRPWDKLSDLYSGGRDVIAGFSPLVFRAARTGDASAREIIDRNFGRLLRLIGGARNRYGDGLPVICAGGITNNPEFAEYFKAHGVTPIFPGVPPVYGACVRCFDLYGEPVVTDEEFDQSFLQTLPD